MRARRLLVVLVVLVALVGCGSGSGGDEKDAEPGCAELRSEFVTDEVQANFDESQRIREAYEDAGCRELCGDLVEDSDTPATETEGC